MHERELFHRISASEVVANIAARVGHGEADDPTSWQLEADSALGHRFLHFRRALSGTHLEVEPQRVQPDQAQRADELARHFRALPWFN